MSKGKRFSNKNVAIPEMRVVVEVTATETGRGNADLELVCSWFWQFSCFLGGLVSAATSPSVYTSTHNSEVSDPVENGCLDLGGHRGNCST